MTFEFKIDSEAGVIFSKFDGVVSEQDVQAARAQILSDPNYRPSLDQLVDYTTARVNFGSDGAFRLAQWAGIHKPFRKLAFVVGNEQYPFLRMYASYAGHEWQDLKIFEDMNSARQWLGLPEED